MDGERFLQVVEARARLFREQALRTTDSVLRELAEQLSGGAAERL